MVHDAATGRFLVSDLDRSLFDTTVGGSATLLGFVPEILKGLAFANGLLYGAAVSSSVLYELDAADGSQIASTPITLLGSPPLSTNGLATHPYTGELWGLFRDGSGRWLGTVDPGTGVVAPVGDLGDRFAGLAFLPEPGGLRAPPAALTEVA